MGQYFYLVFVNRLPGVFLFIYFFFGWEGWGGEGGILCRFLWLRVVEAWGGGGEEGCKWNKLCREGGGCINFAGFLFFGGGGGGCHKLCRFLR